jgi:DNA-binding transcriptional ArsR family regulator
MAPDIEAVAEQVFVALADPTRRTILAALATDGPSTVTELAARLPITRQAIAKHLALMADAGLVTPEPGERRRVRYRLRSAPVQLAQQFLAALAHAWDDRLDALQHYLTAPGGTEAAANRDADDDEDRSTALAADRQITRGSHPVAKAARRHPPSR